MKDKRDLVRALWVKGEHDLGVARRELAGDDPATEAVGFHAQQAAERQLKAWLIWHGIQFPFTHNIEVLLALAEKQAPAFVALRPAEALTPYAVEVRYAEDLVFPSLAEARAALALAETVRRFVREQFAALKVDPAGSG